MKEELLAFKKFQLVPHDNIEEGLLQYNVDTDTGVIAYSYDITVKIFFITYPFKGSGTAKADPAQLISKNLKVGQALNIGPVSVVVKSIDSGKATCALLIKNQDIDESGEVVFDVTGEFLELLWINENGTIKGFSEEIEAQSE